MHATITIFKRYKGVTYYTIKCDDSDVTSAEDFFIRMRKNESIIDQLQRLILWMQRVGNMENGASNDLFKPEGNCYAIPKQFKRDRKQNPIDLRLYCYWICPRIVILYNGGNKTKDKAQDCPNVRTHFYQAQSWTKQINGCGLKHNGVEITNLDDILFNC